MTYSAEHVDDSFLSALVDGQLSPAEQAPLLAHLGTCSACAQRLDELRSVVALLRSLPDVEPPRDFALGPRLLVDPPNLVRLQRWYMVARTSAASLAAVFVLLSVGALYVDTRPLPTSTADLAAARDVNTSESAPTAAPQAANPAARSAAPALAPQPRVQAPAPAAGARPAASPQADDQVAAATSIRPLPTPIPTPQPAAVPPVAGRPEAVMPPDTAAPLRYGALVVGTLAVLALLAALMVKHRLRQSPSQF